MQRSRIFGYVGAFAASLFYSMSMVTSQVLGQFVPRLELNLVRFVSQLVLATVLVVALRKNVFRVASWQHGLITVVNGVVYCFMILSINVAALYAPVGNIESVGVLLFVLPATAYNMFRCRASCAVVVGAIIACVGVLLLLQPEFLFGGEDGEAASMQPCAKL